MWASHHEASERMRLILSILLLASATAALAGGTVYRYVDKDGVTHYTDKPPTPDAKPANLPPLQTISPATPLSQVTGSRDDAAAAPADAAAATGKFTLRITSPAPDDTIRTDDGKVAVSATSDPPLGGGTGLLYLLDGAAQNKTPVSSLSYTLQNVERGEHTVAVAAVDAGGKEVTRSAPVTIFMKPPTVDMAPKIPKPGKK
jgi:hypothetical protein